VLKSSGYTYDNIENHFYVKPESFIVYTPNEIPYIFSKNAAFQLLFNKTLAISVKRRKHNAVELSIDLTQFFSKYEIEVYSENDNKPLIKCISDRDTFFVNNIEESQRYVARVRGFIEEYKMYSKWSEDCPFYSLKSISDYYFSIIN